MEPLQLLNEEIEARARQEGRRDKLIALDEEIRLFNEGKEARAKFDEEKRLERLALKMRKFKIKPNNKRQ